MLQSGGQALLPPPTQALLDSSAAYAVDALGCRAGAAPVATSYKPLLAPFTTSFTVPEGMWGTPGQLAIRMAPSSASSVAFGLKLQIAGGTVSMLATPPQRLRLHAPLRVHGRACAARLCRSRQRGCTCRPQKSSLHHCMRTCWCLHMVHAACLSPPPVCARVFGGAASGSHRCVRTLRHDGTTLPPAPTHSKCTFDAPMLHTTPLPPGV
jgi:hypothetical protein